MWSDILTLKFSFESLLGLTSGILKVITLLELLSISLYLSIFTPKYLLFARTSLPVAHRVTKKHPHNVTAMLDCWESINIVCDALVSWLSGVWFPSDTQIGILA